MSEIMRFFAAMSLCAILAGCSSKEEGPSINEQLVLGKGHWIWFAEQEEIYLKSDGRFLERRTKREPTQYIYMQLIFKDNKSFVSYDAYPSTSLYGCDYWVADGNLYVIQNPQLPPKMLGTIAVDGDYMTLKFVGDYSQGYPSYDLWYPQKIVFFRSTVTYVRADKQK